MRERAGPRQRHGTVHCPGNRPCTRWRPLGGERPGIGLRILLIAARRAGVSSRMSLGRVLVVDDEPQIRRVLRSTLSARGYEVHESRTGEDALESIRGSRFDLILLDVNMPGMSGLATCREIREGSEVAIIMLTVSDSEEDKV